MSPLWRLLPSALAISASIPLGWPLLIAALGQGAHFIASGWYGSLLGIVVLTAGLIVPLIGLAAALGLAALLRFPDEQLPMKQAPFDDLVAASFALFALACVVPGTLMWWLSPPQATSNSNYGTAFAITVAVMVGIFALWGGALCSHVLARRKILAEQPGP